MKEIWLSVVGWEGLYSISNLGNIRNDKNGVVTHPKLCLSYKHISLPKNGKQINRTIHSLVAEAFLGSNPNGLLVNHKNGNKQDNRLFNLEYVTPQENTLHYHRVLKPLLSKKVKAKKVQEIEFIELPEDDTLPF